MTSMLTAELLRAHVNKGSARSARHGEHADRIAHTPCNSEIGDFEFVFAVDHQVRWLEIAMYHARSLVGIGERFTQLFDPFLNLIDFEEALLLPRFQSG